MAIYWPCSWDVLQGLLSKEIYKINSPAWKFGDFLTHVIISLSMLQKSIKELLKQKKMKVHFNHYTIILNLKKT